MTRDQLINCGRVMRALLTEFDSDRMVLERDENGETLTCERGEGLRYSVAGQPTCTVPEAAFEDRWEIVA